MSARHHPDGFCTCKAHVDRPWDRSEHWRQDEVEYLERWYGRSPDDAIACRLGRPVSGVHQKAKRLGLHKRDAGFTARDVAAIFGVDGSEVGKIWIRRGLLPALRVGRAYADRNYPGVSRGNGRVKGPGRPGRYQRPAYWIIAPAAVERFIAEHPEWVDVAKMPASPYRDLAARDPWVSLAEVHRLTGRSHHPVARMIAAGEVRGARRGTHWYMPLADVGKVRPLRSPDAIAESWFRRQSVLEHRRARRKGISVVGRGRRAAVPVVLAKVAS